MVNGTIVDDKAVAMLREEIEKIKSTMVSRESYELLQRDLKATKEALDTYKRDNNKKLADLMNEVSIRRKKYITVPTGNLCWGLIERRRHSFHKQGPEKYFLSLITPLQISLLV